jgi:hypothetical protein
MAVEIHVTGRVQLGHFAEFIEAAARWQEFRAARGAAPCRVLHALSGEMNAVRLVFTYPDLNTYEREEARDAADPEYARAAGAVPFVEGTLTYEPYRESEVYDELYASVVEDFLSEVEVVLSAGSKPDDGG